MSSASPPPYHRDSERGVVRISQDAEVPLYPRRLQVALGVRRGVAAKEYEINGIAPVRGK